MHEIVETGMGTRAPAIRRRAIARGAFLGFLLALGAGFASIATPDSRAEAERPGHEESQALVNDLVHKAFETWHAHPDPEARKGAILALIESGFDVNFITRGVLGREWRQLDDAQRTHFRDVFSDYVMRVYLPDLAKYGPEHLRVLGAGPLGKRDTVVKSQVRGDSEAWIDTDWRVRLVKGEPRIIDVVPAGVSLLLLQRREFKEVIARDGFDGLIARLNEAGAGGAAQTGSGGSN